MCRTFRLPGLATSTEDNGVESYDYSNLLIETASGLVNGIDINDEVQAWLGIPYAENPTGKSLKNSNLKSYPSI